MKGYTYTYYYGGTNQNINAIAAPQVSWQNKGTISAYSRPIYPSDIAYDSKNATEELNVEVVYRIDITNTTNYDIEELHQAKLLNITSITDTFDTNRYELNDSNWTASGNSATMKSDYINQIYGGGINKNESASPAFIRFKVKHSKLLEILNHPNGIIETNPTSVHATGYHSYTRLDYGWDYGGGGKVQSHITPDVSAEDEAPYLIFKLGQERTMTGKVFKDTIVTTNGEKLGNGLYNEKEDVLQGVKVELLDDEYGLPVSSLYEAQGIGNAAREAISKPAITQTDNSGNYILKGIVPGMYYLRFTYIDGTQKIFDVNGNEKSYDLQAKDYKSTIVTSEAAKAAFKDISTGYKEEWYKHLEDSEHSVAVDDLEMRKAVNEENKSNMAAKTAKISITVENTIAQSATVEDTETAIDYAERPLYEGLNLGIIEQPNEEVTLEKIISNIKLTNAQGNILFDGNPETDQMKGVSDLDKVTNGGSTYTRVELSGADIYGSTLELTYDLKVKNISDINYCELDAQHYGWYYMFGEHDNAYSRLILLKPEMYDYPDPTTKYDSYIGKNGVIVKKLTKKVDSWVDSDNNENKNVKDKVSERERKLRTEENIVHNYKEVLEVLGMDRIGIGETKEATVRFTRLLSEDEDMEIINGSEITTLTKVAEIKPGDVNIDSNPTVEETLKLAINPKIPPPAEAKLTLTPPTGMDKQSGTVYIIAGIISFIILSTGVIVIKKKIL